MCFATKPGPLWTPERRKVERLRVLEVPSVSVQRSPLQRERYRLWQRDMPVFGALSLLVVSLVLGVTGAVGGRQRGWS